ncbi:hypothetical protein ACQP0C_41810 (plasmid) [Nocardia sp. CA-129566]|uniref:hypothetical protein n=1 Tax=Nocardia sp. CA-129566 TaxID=3239976 RepID=UPI003D99E599
MTPPPAPRQQKAPENVLDSVDRQLLRATADDYTLTRYLTLLRFLRSTVLMVGGIVVVAAAVFGVGIGAALYLAGVSLKMTVGFSALGSGITIGVATSKGGAIVRLVKRATTGNEETSDSQPDQTERAEPAS